MSSQLAADGKVEEYTLNDLFSLRRPRDFRAGLASGSKSLAKGVLGGAMGLVAAPVMGALQGGVLGFGKGVLAGVAAAAVLPVVGAGIAVTQVVRGAVAEPTAISERLRGREWDQENREWRDRPSMALIPDDPAFAALRERIASQAGASTSGEGFYTLLNVPKDASPEQIKRQYYLLARRMHPDKNPDDPEAKAKFQRLGEAYQVLSNPELRERYDKHGEQALDVDFMDSAEFFTMLFGSDRFDYLLGELSITFMARCNGDFSPTKMRQLQMEREQMLTINLKALLRRYVEGDGIGFRESMLQEAAELSQASFGPTILGAIGRTYLLCGEAASGHLLQGPWASLRQTGQGVKSKVHAARLALKFYTAQQRIERLDAEHERIKAQHAQEEASQEEQQELVASNVQHQAEKAKLEEATLPLMLEVMWAANVVDIQTTLRHVARTVLRDPDASRGTCAARAQGLKVLGQLFCDAAEVATLKQAGQEVASAKQQMEAAMQRVVDKRVQADDAAHAARSPS